MKPGARFADRGPHRGKLCVGFLDVSGEVASIHLETGDEGANVHGHQVTRLGRSALRRACSVSLARRESSAIQMLISADDMRSSISARVMPPSISTSLR